GSLANTGGAGSATNAATDRETDA
ncbi:fimbrial assembly protein FimA, partial [Salmonella enterica subsp. houtenae]|nr:fimbrial assembly protein FimA [Salmonella enterica subsp. houtenae]